jgi:hypothetical protein
MFPSRSDRIATSHCRALAQPAPPAKALLAPIKPSEKSPGRVNPAGIAGALLHHPGARHQAGERNGDGRQGSEIKAPRSGSETKNLHAKYQISRLEVGPIQNTLMTKPGFNAKFP